VSALISRTVAVRELDHEVRQRMYAIFETYYTAVSQEQFEIDLANKDAVILLLERGSNALRGFSTLRQMVLTDESGRTVRAIFSGDTVVEAAFWGQKVLGVAFLRYLWFAKLKRPFEPLYWFLISKGYKTYLLMANNFPTHYPRYECATPLTVQVLIHRFAQGLFGADYDPESGLIRYAVSKGQLKSGVAEATPDEMVRFPRIRFFEQKNPYWRDGAELVCLAEMTFGLPFAYGWKRLKKVTLAPFYRLKARPVVRDVSVAIERESGIQPLVGALDTGSVSDGR
jgi:hypothetical protein